MSEGSAKGNGDISWLVLLALGAFNAVDGLLLVVFGGEAEQDTISRVV